MDSPPSKRRIYFILLLCILGLLAVTVMQWHRYLHPVQPSAPLRHEVQAEQARPAPAPAAPAAPAPAPVAAATPATNVTEELKPFPTYRPAVIPMDNPVPGENLADYVEEALRVLRRNASVEEKLAAMRPIENMCHPAAMPAIMLALEDDSLLVRDAAVEAMKFMDDPAVIPAVEKALDDADADIREDALVALNVLFGEDINGPLSKAIEDKNPDVRSAAFDVMLLQSSPATLPTLEKAVTHDSEGLQQNAVMVLEEVPDPHAIDLLINEALLSDFDSVRADATEALKRVTGQSRGSFTEWAQWWDAQRGSVPQGADEDAWRAYWSDFRASRGDAR